MQIFVVFSWSLPQVSPADGLKPLQRARFFFLLKGSTCTEISFTEIFASLKSPLWLPYMSLGAAFSPAAASPHRFLFSTHTSQPRPSLKIPHSHISSYSFLIHSSAPLSFLPGYFLHLVKLSVLHLSAHSACLIWSCSVILPEYHPDTTPSSLTLVNCNCWCQNHHSLC